MYRPRFVVLVGLIFATAAARLVPHLPNFSPIAAFALFGGAQFAQKRVAFVVPLVALFLSDLVRGSFSGMFAVYASFALIVGIGFWVRRHQRILPIAAAAFASSVVFFVITNFAVWAQGAWYPLTAAGLGACYVAAIPFFQNTVAGDLFYTAVLFGGLALAEKRWPVLAETA